MQAYTNYTNGSTQLSTTTCFLFFFGSLTGIFISIQETDDVTIIRMFVCATLANSIIVAQFLYYWNVDVMDKENVKKS